jgi:RNA polymerase sigma factor, sigma-70 family/RNA polymerase sigma factor, TIGR02999 family
MAISMKALDHYRMNESNQRPVAEKSSRSESAGWEAYRVSPALGEVSRLLAGWGGGDAAALDELIPLVYDELKRLAHYLMRRERPDHTLQATALVDEAYIRLADQKHGQWKNRAQFFSIAAQFMRRILVDHARSHFRAKRGGGAHKVALDEVAVLSPERGADVIALDAALERLAAIDPRKSAIVELRYFGGLSVEEAAETMGVSPITIKRDWLVAKAWLRREISNEA